MIFGPTGTPSPPYCRDHSNSWFYLKNIGYASCVRITGLDLFFHFVLLFDRLQTGKKTPLKLVRQNLFIDLCHISTQSDIICKILKIDEELKYNVVVVRSISFPTCRQISFQIKVKPFSILRVCWMKHNNETWFKTNSSHTGQLTSRYSTLDIIKRSNIHHAFILKLFSR